VFKDKCTNVLLLTGILPPGKKFHLFVSHSTSDRNSVREGVIVPLRNKQREVLASYHCMPDPNRFDDKAIIKAMTESCVVMVCISGAYLSSQRYGSVCVCYLFSSTLY